MRLDRTMAGTRWHIRPDGPDKVTGRLAYLTDMGMPGMLYGKILRSAYPHAWILSIDTSRAQRLPGVHAVLTHRDVPGLNLFGIAVPDQPVLCEDRVRFAGDAVAAVAAETEELAEYALTLIEVVYEPLPVIDSRKRGCGPMRLSCIRTGTCCIAPIMSGGMPRRRSRPVLSLRKIRTGPRVKCTSIWKPKADCSSRSRTAQDLRFMRRRSTAIKTGFSCRVFWRCRSRAFASCPVRSAARSAARTN